MFRSDQDQTCPPCCRLLGWRFCIFWGGDFVFCRFRGGDFCRFWGGNFVDFGADAGFSVTNLGNLDKIRHNQGFSNSSRKIAG